MGRFANFFKEQSVPLDGQSKQKMLSLDAQFENMEAERDALKTENLHLKAQVNPLERRIEQLQRQIADIGKKEATPGEEFLDDKALALLSAIAKNFQIAKNGGATIIKGTAAQATYYLGLLKERQFIRYMGGNYTLDGRYVATQHGLAYLHKLGKL